MGCKGLVTNLPWESLHMSSLGRGVSHQMVYFLLPRVLDLLPTFKHEGCLLFLQPLTITPLQAAHPLHHLQGPYPKQDLDEPLMEGRMPTSHLKPSASPTVHPRAWIVTTGQESARTLGSRAFTSHLSHRKPSTCCHHPKIAAKSAFPACRFMPLETHFSRRRAPLSCCCSPGCDHHR